MTQQFHEGQDVEVASRLGRASLPKASNFSRTVWRKAKIVGYIQVYDDDYHQYLLYLKYKVQFPDGTRAVLDAEHIRTIEPRARIEYPSNYHTCADGENG